MIFDYRSLLLVPLSLCLVGVSRAETGAFDGCGVLVAGVTCQILFQPDAGGGLLFTDADYAAAGVSVGDRVRIVGDFDPTCFTICNQTVGCVFMAAILPDNCTGNPIGTNYCTPAQPNSTGQPGEIQAFGSTAVADNDLTLVAENLPDGQFGYFLCSQNQGFVPNPGGSVGNLCLGGTIGRFNAQVGVVVNGELSLAVDLGALPLSPPVAVLPGQTWHFQCWYRDLMPNPTSNFTDATSVSFI